MRTMTMEELLTWAFVDELPKGGGVNGLDNPNSAWRSIENSLWGTVAALGTRVDEGRSGGANYFIEQGEPHADAVATGRAVAELGKMDIVLSPGWNPLADWPDTEGLAEQAVANIVRRVEARGQERRGREMVALVVGTAVLNRQPDWSSEPSRVRLVERGGKPAWFMARTVTDELGQAHMMEVDGYDRRVGKPHAEAYRKQELSDDPSGDILSRLDHQIWVAACARIESDLPARLAAHRVRPVERRATPWLPREGLAARIVEASEKK